MNVRSFCVACCVALAVATSAGLASPVSAAAIKCAPPAAGVDQYFETVPGGVCNLPSTNPDGGNHGSLPPGTASQLSKQGRSGQAVLRLVSPNPAPVTGRGAHASNRSGAALSASGSGFLAGLLGPVLAGSSSGGLGVLLPVLLIAALLVLLGVLVLRRRFSSS